MDGIITWFQETLGWWGAFFVSMLPLIELRGGLIIAAATGMSIFLAVPVCVIGNVIPIPFILWFITPIFTWLKKTKLFRPLVEKLENRAMGKSEKIQKGYFWGLALFVGIPLPGTGAWTGALIASMLGIPFKKSFPAILLGLLIATIIMSILCYFLPGVFMTLFA